VPICKTFLVTEAERSMSGDDGDFNNTLNPAVLSSFVQVNPQKEIHAFLIETIGEHAQSGVNAKNWVTQFKRGDFSTCVAPRREGLKTLNTPRIID